MLASVICIDYVQQSNYTITRSVKSQKRWFDSSLPHIFFKPKSMTFLTTLYFWISLHLPCEAILPRRLRIPAIAVIETPYKVPSTGKILKSQHKVKSFVSRRMLKK